MNKNIKISELPELSALNDDVIIPVVSNGKTHKIGHKLISEKLKNEIPTKVSQLANDRNFTTNEQVQQMIEDSGGADIDTSNFYNKDEIDTKLKGKADSSHTHSQYLTEHQSLDNYVTTAQIGEMEQNLNQYLSSTLESKVDVTTFNQTLQQANTAIDDLQIGLSTLEQLKADKDSIPTKTSQLINDSSFITKNSIIPISEDMVTITKDVTKGVAPYSTSYGYTNITVNELSEDDLYEGLLIVPLINTSMVVTSAYRNVRIRFGENGTWHPFFGASSILAGSTYFTKSNYRIYQYRTHYQAIGAFHIISDSNSTYSPMSLGFGLGKCTTATDTIAKVVELASYTLTANGFVTIQFTNDVAANATMNINAKGAKPIYYKDSAITDGIIKAGDTATFIYSDGKYNVIGILKSVNLVDEEQLQNSMEQAFTQVQQMIQEAIGGIENGSY